MFIQSRTASSEGHATYVLFSIGHSGSFQVILIGVTRNPEWDEVARYNNVDLISETYEDIAM